MWNDITEALSRLDAWANKAQLHWPKFLRVNTEDVNLAGRIAGRLFQLIIVLALLVGIGWVLYWFTTYGPRPKISEAEQQHIIPTLEPTATAIPNGNPWLNESWLSQTEAQNLRGQTNVVNLAILEGGGVKYSRNHGVIFSQNAPWQEIKPLELSTLSVDYTAVTFTLNGQKYGLNVYQPFVDAENPLYIYVIDASGKMWRGNVDSVQVASLEEAKSALPITINANPNLSFTY